MAEHRVYVFRLQDRVWKESPRFRRANPDYRPGKPVVYVGSTGLAIDQRLEAHLAGGRTANRYVNKYFKRKMPREYEHIPVYKTRRRAEAREKRTALELRARGWGVWFA